MKTPPKDSKFPYNQACIALALGIALILWGAYLHGCIELMGSFMFGLLILWQVINGLVIKRHFWHIPEDRATFWALLVALLLGGGMLYLCLDGVPTPPPSV